MPVTVQQSCAAVVALSPSHSDDVIARLQLSWLPTSCIPCIPRWSECSVESGGMLSCAEVKLGGARVEAAAQSRRLCTSSGGQSAAHMLSDTHTLSSDIMGSKGEAEKNGSESCIDSGARSCRSSDADADDVCTANAELSWGKLAQPGQIASGVPKSPGNMDPKFSAMLGN